MSQTFWTSHKYWNNCFGPIELEQALKKIFLFQTEDEDKDEQIKRECEKIFHPEKFEFHDLTTSLPTIETPNIDWWVMSFLSWIFIAKMNTLNSLISTQQILFFLRKFQGKFLPTRLFEYLYLIILAEIPNYMIIFSSFKLLFCYFNC